MKTVRVVMFSLLIVLLCARFSPAQQSLAVAANATVPPLIPFSSVATDDRGNSLSGVVNITFALYSSQQGGAPLWTETQDNIQLDSAGHYSVQLGITQPNGVPTTLFTTGEARWLGVRISGETEPPRVLLLSVPYALKAGDAATIGGLPPSAFVLAAPASGSTPAGSPDASAALPSLAPPAGTAVTGTGTVNFLPLWNSTSDILSSVLFQSGTGATAKVGINTTSPATTLDVKGSATVRGALSLPATGTATATKAANSQPMTLAASAFNSTSAKAVAQTFQWQAEAVGNDTTTPSGTLNFLFGSGTTKPAETGLHIASTGVITFNAAQTFPNTISGITTASGSGLTGGGTAGTLSLGLLTSCSKNQVLEWSGTAWICATVGGGSGSITGVTAGTDLLGGGTSGNVTLSVDTSKIPLLGATNNSFTGAVTAAGIVQGEAINSTSGDLFFGGLQFDYGSPLQGSGNGTSYLGFAGNGSTTGTGNVGAGYAALQAESTGSYNTAVGLEALLSNSSGQANTGVGSFALFTNGSGASSTGSNNTAMGYSAAGSNVSGGYNTAIGSQALENNTTGIGNTAVGTSALINNVGPSTSVPNVGNYNTAVGYAAGPTFGANLLGSTAVGFSAAVSGSTATAVGDSSSALALSSTAIGSVSYVGPSATNSTAIGYESSVTTPSSLVLGQALISSPGILWDNVGIGTSAPRSIIEADASVAEGLGPTVTLTNTAGGGNTSTSLDFNSYPPSTTGTYNPSARILVEDAGQFSDNILFQSNVPGAPNHALQTNMEINSAGQVAIPGAEINVGAQLEVLGTGGTGAAVSASGGTVGGEGVIAVGGPSSSSLNAGDGIDAAAGSILGGTGGYAGNFLGNVAVSGNLSKSGGSFKIDHPLDPANKYLYHSFVESPDMMNIYNGNVTTDAQGTAVVALPDWFETLNRDFRYQLTVIGQFAQAIVGSKVANHQFSIKTDKPNVEVSWQITGIRQDAWANAHRIPVEEQKDERERGHYIHPELYGAPVEQSVEWARHPAMMQNWQRTRARQSAEAQGQSASASARPLQLAAPPNPKEPELRTPLAASTRTPPRPPTGGPKPMVRSALQPSPGQPAVQPR